MTETDKSYPSLPLPRTKRVSARPLSSSPKPIAEPAYNEAVEPLEFGELESWESEAISLLARTLDHRTLERLVGDFQYTIRQLRRLRTGVDRRGTKVELAHALLLRHQRDLFAQKVVRDAVARALRVDSPERWIAGKNAAREFVKQVNFPWEMAGEAEIDTRFDHEYLEPGILLRPLEKYQEEVMRGIRVRLEARGERGIMSLPTGAGKTRIAVEAIQRWLSYPTDPTISIHGSPAVLWLAHTEELCEQAYTCFKQVWRSAPASCALLLMRFWGSFTSNFDRHANALDSIGHRPCVIVSTPNRIVALLDDDKSAALAFIESLKKHLGVLVIDEAHRAAAPSYRRILNGVAQESTSVVGLTATPFRMEYLRDPYGGTKELAAIFNESLIEPVRSLGENPRLALQEMGVLARVRAITVDTKTVIRLPSSVVISDEPFAEDEAAKLDHYLAETVDRGPRRLKILDAILPMARDANTSMLYFGPSVLDAYLMAYLLRAEGVLAVAISADTRESTRRRVVEDFKQGRVRVVCNCEILTTGFDAPRVTHVVMARPTVSRVLYEQMVGRALRGPTFGGTEEAIIVDCLDEFAGEKPQLGHELFRGIWKPEIG